MYCPTGRLYFYDARWWDCQLIGEGYPNPWWFRSYHLHYTIWNCWNVSTFLVSRGVWSVFTQALATPTFFLAGYWLPAASSDAHESRTTSPVWQRSPSLSIILLPHQGSLCVYTPSNRAVSYPWDLYVCNCDVSYFMHWTHLICSLIIKTICQCFPFLHARLLG